MSNDEIEIPEILICAGWPVDDVQSLDDCDDAHAYLTGALAAIEEKIDTLEAVNPYHEALPKTRAARRWKKAAMQIITAKRAKFNREAAAKSRNHVLNHFGEIVRQSDPVNFGVWMEMAQRAATE